MREEPQPGEIFAGHLIEAEIGRGGMGIVLLGRSVALDRRRAIKLIAPELSADPVFAARFRRESRLAASVEHPNVVGVHHAGEEDGLLYLVMPYVKGVDLARVLEDGPVAPDRAARILAAVAAGLDAAHAAGLVHRDVKPANVLIAPGAGGEAERVYLTDFGISKPVATETRGDMTGATALTGFGQVLGTADYTAPEQIEDGRSDARSDVYSLSCVAFHALTGEPPFRRESELATLIAHTKAPRPEASAVNRRLPAAIDAPLRDGMAIEPELRPASAGALARRVGAVLAGEADPQPPTRPRRTTSRGPLLSRAAIAAVMLALAAIAVVGMLLLTRTGDEGGTAAPAPTVQTSAPGAVGEGPSGVAVGEVRVWVASRGSDQVDRLRQGRPVKYKAPVSLKAPRQLVVAFDSTWVVNGRMLYRLNPSLPAERVTPIDVGGGPVDVAADSSYVWVANRDEGTVARIDPQTNEVSARVDVGSAPNALATGKGAVYVTSAAGGTVTKVDRESATVVRRPAELGGAPSSLAVASGGIWVADAEAATLTRLAPGTLQQEGAPIDVAARPRAVAVGLGSIWVASEAEDAVQRFNPTDGAPQGEPIEVGAGPADVAVGTGAVYTANAASASVSRIEP